VIRALAVLLKFIKEYMLRLPGADVGSILILKTKHGLIALDDKTSYARTLHTSGPGSSVGIATDYGLDGPGSNSGGDEIFPPVQTGPGAHPASCKMGTGSFPGVKCGRGVGLTSHPI